MPATPGTLQFTGTLSLSLINKDTMVDAGTDAHWNSGTVTLLGANLAPERARCARMALGSLGPPLRACRPQAGSGG